LSDAGRDPSGASGMTRGPVADSSAPGRRLW
jgi:hypothetical protein